MNLRADAIIPAAIRPPGRAGAMALFGLLGFSAGLPYFMFSTVLALRLQAHGVGLTIIGFFAWISLLPTMKFLWAPMLDRLSAPGFSRFWGQRRGWVMLAQVNITASLVAMAFTSADHNLPLTALFATLLAFWTTTLEIASDAWRITLYPQKERQGPVVAATVWGYRGAMIAASSGALLMASEQGWTVAYLFIAVVGFIPFPLLAAMPPEPGHGGGRLVALATGVMASALSLMAVALTLAALGAGLLALADAAGITAASNVTPVVLGLCLLPFAALAFALPRIRRMQPDAPMLRSPVTGPYVDIFWRFGTGVLALLALVSLYRMGDVLALTLSKPLVASLGYSLREIGIADGAIALAGTIAGVGIGGFAAARWPLGRVLALGAIAAALGNFSFVWLAHQPIDAMRLYIATFLDQFGNGMGSAAFVVYLSLLVNPRHPGAQYAFLSGFAFLLPRLLAGASGAMVADIGYDGFFLLTGALSLAALPLLPFVMRLRPRIPEA